VAQGLSAIVRLAGILWGGSRFTRKFTHFLPFGLTWSQLRLTVTVRNHYSMRRLARGPEHAI